MASERPLAAATLPPEDDAILAMENAGPMRVAEQQSHLPPAWQAIDRGVILGSEFTLFLVGVLFTVMITLGVISRYLLDFSMFFVDAAARLLLVWFFLLGAGIALRHGAHVGFELLLSWLQPRRRRAMRLLGYALTMIFFAEMLYGGFYALRPAMAQTEAGLGISLVWIVAAVPVGFLLLSYHLCVLILVELRGHGTEIPAS